MKQRMKQIEPVKLLSSQKNIGKIITIIILVLTILTLVIRYTEPVQDGDLWWQMAYGRYMIENRTLIPDHTIYTWSPTDNTAIYCAWIAEIMLYLMHEIGGMPLLYVFKYFCMLLFVALALLYARHIGILWNPITGLVILLGVLMSGAAALIKPEIFSYVLFLLFVVNWFFIKTKKNIASTWKLAYLFPIITLLWANSHGAFIFGGLFIALISIGELINYFLDNDEALPPKLIRHVFIAFSLCGVSVFINPYGYHLIVNIITNLQLEQFDIAIETIGAYQTIFTKTNIHYHEYLFLSLALMVYQIYTSKKIDWAIIISIAGMGMLYVMFLRTTYFFPIVFVITYIYLAKPFRDKVQDNNSKYFYPILLTIAALSIFLTGREVYEKAYGYIGIDSSFSHPIEEASYIQKNFSRKNIGNDYNNGGYLLWKLGPETKILIDPRWFPFKDWYHEYNKHMKFKNTSDIEQFIKNYPCDIWCIHLRPRDHILNWFYKSGNWKIAYYGANSIVFVNTNKLQIPGNKREFGKGIFNIKNPIQSLLVLDFTTDIGDWENGEKVLEGIKRNFSCNPLLKEKVKVADNYFNGKLAYSQKNYIEAIKRLEHCQGTVLESNMSLIASYNHLTFELWKSENDDKALEYTQKALRLNKNDLYALFNNSVIRWWMQKQGKRIPEESVSRRLQLMTFINRTKSIPAANDAVLIAKGILEGTFNKRPPVVYPTDI